MGEEDVAERPEGAAEKKEEVRYWQVVGWDV